MSGTQEFPIWTRQMRDAFKKDFANALRRRLAPNTGLHAEQLAGALGCEGATVRNWLRGENEPASSTFAATIQFFFARGDAQFMAEVMPGVTPLVQRPKRDEKAAEILRQFAQFIQSEVLAA